MATQKYGWKDGLQAAKSKGGGSNDSADFRAKKKLASIHYKRRKLEKEIKRLIKDNQVIKYKDVRDIQNRHGIRCY